MRTSVVNIRGNSSTIYLGHLVEVINFGKYSLAGLERDPRVSSCHDTTVEWVYKQDLISILSILTTQNRVKTPLVNENRLVILIVGYLCLWTGQSYLDSLWPYGIALNTIGTSTKI